jgi:capsular exopolysaccharide synthesis family protein
VNAVPNQGLTLQDIFRVFDRRRRIAIGTLLVFVVLAVLVCVFIPRKYDAQGVIELQKSSSHSLGLDSLMSGMGGGAGSGGGGDSLTANIDLQTQAEILQSDALALQVIRELDLEKNEDFAPRFNPVYWVMGLISGNGPPDPKDAPLEDRPRRRQRLLDVFRANLKVKVTEGTRLMEVDYMSSDPKVAAAVVNHLVQALNDYNFQTKHKTNVNVSRWLQGQLGDLRKGSLDLKAKVVTLQKETGIFGAGGVDVQGRPITYSPILDHLQQSTAQLSVAEMNRILKESVYRIASTGNAEMLSQLAGTTMSNGGGNGVANSLTLLQNLRAQEATQEALIGQDATVFGPSDPKLVEDRANLKKVQQSIEAEVARVAERAKNDFQIALNTEQGARTAYNADRTAAEKLNDKAIEYSIAEREAEQSQALYEDLQSRLREAGILGSLHATNLSVVNGALAPAKPARPNVPLYLAIGVGAGIFFGFAVALFVDAIDDKLQGTEEVEAMALPLLGLLPLVKPEKSKQPSTILDARNWPFGEAVRKLRSTLLISRSAKPPQVLMVTSGSSQEGKSTLSLALAISLAQLDKTVLLLEADMRRPVLSSRTGMALKGGLSVLLTDREAGIEPIPSAEYPNLHFMPAGPLPHHPAELLASERMHSLLKGWRSQYDFVVMDCPPALPVSDVQLLECLADATILVARAGFTTRIALNRAYQLLCAHVKDPATPSIGIVLNFVSQQSSAYYGYYGYYGNRRCEYPQSKGQDGDA